MAAVASAAVAFLRECVFIFKIVSLCLVISPGASSDAYFAMQMHHLLERRIVTLNLFVFASSED
jgi:hypothetical protein